MSLIDFLEAHDVEFKEQGEHHHTTEGWLQVDCPWCSKGWGNFRMGLGLEAPTAMCWVCGQHNFWETLYEITGVHAEHDKTLYTTRYHESEQDAHLNARLVFPEHLMTIETGSVFARYLKKRGLCSESICSLWNLKGIGLCKHLAWRLFIPVIENDKTISWTTRSLSDKGKRYLNATSRQEVKPMKEVLYGSDLADHAVLVVEGPADAWAVGPGCVATLGVSFTQSQVTKISKFARRIICFDAEDLAQKQARKLCRMLQAFPGETTNVVMSTGKDPSRCEGWELAELRRMLH